jgi:hypothetical protein
VEIARELFMLSAKTPEAKPLLNEPPRNGSTAHPQYYLFINFAMCSGFCSAATFGIHDNPVFCLSAWRQAPLSSLYWMQPLKAATSDYESRAARKPTLSPVAARGLFKFSAKTPEAKPSVQLPPRNGSTAYPQIFFIVLPT